MNNNISLGNKVIGIISFISVIAAACLFVVISVEGYFLGIALLLLSAYTFQASKITYIEVVNRQFIIESVFKRRVIKELKEYKGVTKVGFGNLMAIQFFDKSRYFFWGKSEKVIDNYIKRLM